MLWDLQGKMLVFKPPFLMSKAWRCRGLPSLGSTLSETLSFSRLHPGWKQPSPPWQMGFGEAPSKRPLQLRGASSPCQMGPPRALWPHGDRPGDTSVLPSLESPGTVVTASMCHRGHSRAGSGGLFPRARQTRSRNTGSTWMSPQQSCVFTPPDAPVGSGGFLVS